MFAKKFLRIVGTLFVASHFVAATNDLVTCPATISNDCDTPIDISSSKLYCISGTEIYKYGVGTNSGSRRRGVGACTTKSQVGEGIHVFQVNTAESDVVELTLGTSTVADSDKGKLSVFICDSSKNCVRTAGYALFNSNYYKITGTSSDKIGAVTDIVDSSCSASNHGEIISVDTDADSSKDTVYVCLNASKKIEFETGNYLVESAGTSGSYVIGTGSPFTLKDVNTANLVVKADTNYVVFDPLFKTELINGSEPYCLNENNKLEDRLTNRCNSDNCDYYTCIDGTCIASTSNKDRSEGDGKCDLDSTEIGNCKEGDYYIANKDSTVLKTSTGEGDLYLCSTIDTSFACRKQTSTPIGYIKNADTIATDIPYISCNASNVCEAVGVSQSTCSGATNDGKLILDTASSPAANQLTLCLDDSIKVVIEGTIGSYFVNGQSGSVYYGTAGRYVIVDVNNGNALLQKKASTTEVRYKYVGSTDYKITDRTTAQTPSTGICTTGMNEFVNDEDDAYTSAYVYNKGTSDYPEA